MNADWDVPIVGGGAAGIGAARRLAGTAVRALLVEAGPRLGGRAWTAELAGLPLDLGCGWLHSGERNAWTAVAEASGVAVERGPAAWRQQFRDLGFPPDQQDAADEAFAAWYERLPVVARAGDRAADALAPGGAWNAYVQAIVGYISGARLDRLSAADYVAYDSASTEQNWRVPSGYGALVAASVPVGFPVRLATPVLSLDLDAGGIAAATPAGTIRARAAILTVSTAVLARGALRLPAALEPWREAAACLPLGDNEKLFLEIVGPSPFEPETHVIGDPRDPATGSYYIRPFGRPVVEVFLGGEGGRLVADRGPAEAFAFAQDQLATLFGAQVRRSLRPLAASSWSRTTHVGGGYSYAVPGEGAARRRLAAPFDDRVFFAGEASHETDFSTAHGAHDTGLRAAEEAVAVLRARRPA
ncbi:flavin monoamine oxidase family protein [Prosthecomicrobium sp. N25]|uniref:flavin monoamine oxidase family protein n=1 Tax=Prosthecomicrobium sp. N25 TaxID=3129254 RepID=UPI003076FD64